MLGGIYLGETYAGGTTTLLPAGTTTVTITGTIVNPDGTPAQGQITATLSETIVNGTQVFEPAPIKAILDGSGQLESPTHGAFRLVANDDSATVPADSFYTFDVELDGYVTYSFTAVVPSTAPNGTIDLSVLEH